MALKDAHERAAEISAEEGITAHVYDPKGLSLKAMKVHHVFSHIDPEDVHYVHHITALIVKSMPTPAAGMYAAITALLNILAKARDENRTTADKTEVFVEGLAELLQDMNRFMEKTRASKKSAKSDAERGSQADGQPSQDQSPG